MSLSDRERRLLAEMEQALATDDPRLESALAGSTMTQAKPRLLLGAAIIFLGIGIIFGGLIAKQTPVGVLGFLCALTGVLMLIRSIGAPSLKGAKKSKGAGKSLSARLEERWDRRNLS
jgi:uncharacterized membrane protein HdeD (DUF308 family)